MGGIGSFLFGSGPKKVATGTPEQDQLHNNILAQAMGLSQQGGGYQQSQDYYNSLFSPGNEAYERFASPFMNQFEEQLLPQIAERFAGAGALSSSGFGQALGGAASGLQSQLAQLFAQLQSQAAGAQTNQYNQLSQLGLGHEQFAYQPGSTGLIAPLLISLAGGVGQGIGGNIGQGKGKGIFGG